MSDPRASFPKGGILDLAATLAPNSFEEKMAKDLRICSSTGKSVSIAYHTFGDPNHPMLLLIPGLNCQALVIFDSASCTWLAQQGFYVVRMDNRDVGLSTKFDDVPQKLNMFFYLLPHWAAKLVGERPPYTLNDMADDASALIRHLAPGRKAHVLGVSMGGMIAQCVALRNPELVLSLTLVMTNSGNARIGRTPIKTLLGFLHRPKSDSAEDLLAHNKWFIETYLQGKPADTQVILDLVNKEFPRATYNKGALRQMAAISRAPCRDEDLKKLTIPTHIVHGERDRLVPSDNARHLHKLIPNSKISLLPDMGHFVDDGHTQTFNDKVVSFLRSVDNK